MTRTTAVLLSAAALALTHASAQAQSGKFLDKSYTVNGRPTLDLSVDNAPVHTRSCGDCHEIHIHVDARDKDLADFQIDQSQSGNGVRFSMKQRNHDWHSSGRGPEVTVSVPTESALKLRSDNGELSVEGVHGDVDAHTDNGQVRLAGVQGKMHATTSNGRVILEGVSGSLLARTDNGVIDGAGRFTDVDAQTSNGKINVALSEGSQLSGGVRVKTDNGSVHLRLPHDAHATVDLHSDLGSVRCNLPLSSEQDGDDHHRLRGAINGGGPYLRATTSNGSIMLDAL